MQPHIPVSVAPVHTLCVCKMCVSICINTGSCTPTSINSNICECVHIDGYIDAVCAPLFSIVFNITDFGTRSLALWKGLH